MLNAIPYEIMKLLGWATVILVSLSVSFHLTLVSYKKLVKSNSNKIYVKKITTFLKACLPTIKGYHATFGITALLTGLSHGYLLLRSFEIHTGYLTWSFLLLMGITGASMKINRRKKLYKSIRKIHTAIMYITVVIMITHVVLMQ